MMIHLRNEETIKKMGQVLEKAFGVETTKQNTHKKSSLDGGSEHFLCSIMYGIILPID